MLSIGLVAMFFIGGLGLILIALKQHAYPVTFLGFGCEGIAVLLANGHDRWFK